METKQLNTLDYTSYTDNQEELVNVVLTELETTGYIVIKNFDVDTNDVEASGKAMLHISSLVGTPISHDAVNSIIWDIKSNPASTSNIKTYSEHSHEAELHTDSQYSFYPEDYFGLLTLKPAECGGGESFLLSLKDILTELRALPNGAELEKTLRETDYPFIVPNVFKKSDTEDNEFNFGPILRENEIRFRVDTFEKALRLRPDFCTDIQVEAYNALKDIILNSPSTQNFFLEEKDLIFINNKSMLHGRGEFTDHNRHLLRIRMNKEGANLN
tara:strand:+ start:7178 stop:7993 length:816 start_codon:yes stop_codon:yes gene_type:complete